MKQYTTQTERLRVDGQENLLAIADRLVVAVRNGDTVITWEGSDLTVDGEEVSWHMDAAQTAVLLGSCKVELTIFANGEIYKTKTVPLHVTEAVWDNGGADADD